MVYIVEDVFGTPIDLYTSQRGTIRRFTLQNDAKMSVQIISYGATVLSIKVPDARNLVEDVVFGYDSITGYRNEKNPYFGATVGRVCNRVANGRFKLGGKEIEVSRNWNNKHQLHGGFIGFDKAHWDVMELHEDGVTLRHISPEYHEGYPGQVTATVKYTLTEDNCLHVRMEAETTKTTVVNMTNHSYFNLAGHASGKKGLYEHSIMIKANEISETDADSIPTGHLTEVEGTPYDFRTLVNLGERMERLAPFADGFDDNFCVELEPCGITTIAKAVHPPSGRWLEVASNQPGVQFYTSNNMPDVEKGEEPILGKFERPYAKHGAFCLETQKYPDAVNHPNFPSIILKHGEKYNHEVIYKFGVAR